jgi:hypothetical protein
MRASYRKDMISSKRAELQLVEGETQAKLDRLVTVCVSNQWGRTFIHSIAVPPGVLSRLEDRTVVYTQNIADSITRDIR